MVNINIQEAESKRQISGFNSTKNNNNFRRIRSKVYKLAAIATGFFVLISNVNIKDVQAQDQRRNEYGLGLDFVWYCSQLYGDSAEAVLRENNVYGWKCKVNGWEKDINANHVCRVMYGPHKKAWVGKRSDPRSLYCK